MSDSGSRPATLVVPTAKLTRYLLDTAHPEGGSKARFFVGHGFSIEHPDKLATAILAHAVRAELVRTITTPDAVKYVFESPLAAPNGKSPRVRSVW